MITTSLYNQDSSPLGPSRHRPLSSTVHPSHSILTRTHHSTEPPAAKQQQPDLTITSARIVSDDQSDYSYIYV